MAWKKFLKNFVPVIACAPVKNDTNHFPDTGTALALQAEKPANNTPGVSTPATVNEQSSIKCVHTGYFDSYAINHTI